MHEILFQNLDPFRYVYSYFSRSLRFYTITTVEILFETNWYSKHNNDSNNKNVKYVLVYEVLKLKMIHWTVKIWLLFNK